MDNKDEKENKNNTKSDKHKKYHHHHDEHKGLNLSESQLHDHHHQHLEEGESQKWDSNNTHNHHADDHSSANQTEAEQHQRHHHHHDEDDSNSNSTEAELHEHHHQHHDHVQSNQSKSIEGGPCCRKGKHSCQHKKQMLNKGADLTSSIVDALLEAIKNGINVTDSNANVNIIFAVAGPGGNVYINAPDANVTSSGNGTVKIVKISNGIRLPAVETELAVNVSETSTKKNIIEAAVQMGQPAKTEIKKAVFEESGSQVEVTEEDGEEESTASVTEESTQNATKSSTEKVSVVTENQSEFESTSSKESDESIEEN